jgi:hypothetical protein
MFPQLRFTLRFSLLRPSVEGLVTAVPDRDEEALVRAGGRANIRASVDHLRHGVAGAGAVDPR